MSLDSREEVDSVERSLGRYRFCMFDLWLVLEDSAFCCFW